jgi:hypothetical protein
VKVGVKVGVGEGRCEQRSERGVKVGGTWRSEGGGESRSKDASKVRGESNPWTDDGFTNVMDINRSPRPSRPNPSSREHDITSGRASTRR